jgi:hypothetical protein
MLRINFISSLFSSPSSQCNFIGRNFGILVTTVIPSLRGIQYISADKGINKSMLISFLTEGTGRFYGIEK